MRTYNCVHGTFKYGPCATCLEKELEETRRKQRAEDSNSSILSDIAMGVAMNAALDIASPSFDSSPSSDFSGGGGDFGGGGADGSW